MPPVARSAALAALLLTGAAAAPAAASPAACPPAPVRVVRSIGAPADYNGTYPGIPDVCRIARDGDQAYYYYGLWRSDWPGAGDAYLALKTVLTGPAGTRASFVTRSVPGLQWNDSFTNEGVAPLTVNGTTFQTIKLAHERDGIEGNLYHSIITSWRDVKTGITLKGVEDQIAGQSYGPATTWNAVRVEPAE